MPTLRLVILLVLLAGQFLWDFVQTRPPQSGVWVACDPPTARVGVRLLTLHGQQTVPAGRAYQTLQLPARGIMGLEISAPGYQTTHYLKQDQIVEGRHPEQGVLALHPVWFWIPWVMRPGYSLGLLLALALIMGEAQKRLTQARMEASFRQGKALPGQPVGPYVVDRILGRGGMATVYEAHLKDDPRERRALKLMHAPGAGERFLREARISLKLRHPNLVAFYDYGEYRGLAYLVMEKVEGQTLDRAGLGLASKLECLSQVCQALQVLHEQGVVHRDLKPSNIMVQGAKALLMDFGIARDQNEQALSLPGQAVGTPGYMAPEQILGQPPDARADLYALGVILYECCSGRLPHQAETSYEMITKQLEHAPDPLVGVPQPLCDLVMNLLNREPSHRSGTAADLAARLHQWAQTV
ncbi:MAG: serine/threonine-protein kinase [Vulcanimicrobiota bacterium]